MERIGQFLFVENGPLTLIMSLGLVAVGLLLPQPRVSLRVAGAIAAGSAIVLAGFFTIRVGFVTPEVILFYAFSAIAIISGGLLITQSNPARAALSFALVVLSTCGLFLLQAAPFLMAATIIVYAGAIIVTFLFVLMLAQQEGPSDADQRSREPWLASVTGFVLLGALLYVLQITYQNPDLDTLLSQTQRAAAQDSKAGILEVLNDSSEFNKEFFDNFKATLLKKRSTPEIRRLAEEVEDLTFQWIEADRQGNVQGMRDVLTTLCKLGNQARNIYGSLRPAGDAPLSNLSGPPANVPLTSPASEPDNDALPAIRRDESGWPRMPAANVEYLGRALFTDYLLAVELGGTLLLIATVGAIAIVSRRGEGLS